MKGLASKSLATNPGPADAATDVPRDAALSWTAGQYPSTHDVYFGSTFADVNTASRTTAKGVLASKGQADTTFDPPGVFAYGQTYYWRIDEVNKSADATITRATSGPSRPSLMAIRSRGVTATASSAQPSGGPENTTNGSGLTGDQHGTDGNTMWMTTGQVVPNWIQYQFDKIYKLNDLKVWNSNQGIEAYVGFGAKDVTLEYSADGATWTTLANVPQFAQATGPADVHGQHHGPVWRDYGPVCQANHQQHLGRTVHHGPERSPVFVCPGASPRTATGRRSHRGECQLGSELAARPGSGLA